MAYKIPQPWTSGYYYKANDLVVSNNYLIQCKNAHKGGTFATDVQSNYWKMLSFCRNNILNSNFTLSQRGTTNDSTNNKYNRDRWYSFLSGSGSPTFSASQQSTSYSGTNSTYCQRLTRTDTGTAAASFYNYQTIETQNTLPLVGKTVTLSCKARTNAATPANFQLLLAYGSSTTTDDTAANEVVTGSSVFNCTSSFATYSYTFTVPSSTRTLYIFANANLAAVNNQNNYLEITDVMLNEGPAPSDYSLIGLSIAEELAMCQRYYEKFGTGGIGRAIAGTDIRFVATFKVTKRASPTYSVISTPQQWNDVAVTNKTSTDTTISVYGGNALTGVADTNITGFSGLTVGTIYQCAGDYYAASAEL